ncbi:MAG: TPM domain-containing protein [Actinomycetota bacterium]|nr:TPM domain-containing protein [Actinomycetota bacterium]
MARAGGKGRHPRLLVVAVALKDRETGAYYGGALADRFDGEWWRIQHDVMNPRFADGDIAGGLSRALAEFSDLTGAGRGSGEGGDSVKVGRTPFEVAEEEPADFDDGGFGDPGFGGAGFDGAGAGFALVLILGFVGMVLVALTGGRVGGGVGGGRRRAWRHRHHHHTSSSGWAGSSGSFGSSGSPGGGDSSGWSGESSGGSADGSSGGGGSSSW